MLTTKYEIFENGYNILVQEDGNERQIALHQPEPYIPYRVLNYNGLTDYTASAQKHVNEFIKGMKEPIEKELPIEGQLESVSCEIKELTNRQAETELYTDYRLSRIELGL